MHPKPSSPPSSPSSSSSSSSSPSRSSSCSTSSPSPSPPKKQTQERHDAEIAHWKKTVAEKNVTIKRALLDFRETQQKLRLLEKKQQEGDAQLEKIKQQNQQLQSLNTGLEDKITDLEINYAIAQQDADESKTALSKLEKKSQEDRCQQKNLNTDTDGLQTELENFKTMFSSFQESATRKQKDLKQKLRATEKKCQESQQTLVRERKEFQDDTKVLREQVRTLTLIKELLEAKIKCLLQTIAIDAQIPDASSTSSSVETLKRDVHPEHEKPETGFKKRKTVSERQDRHQRNISDVPTENGINNTTQRLNNSSSNQTQIDLQSWEEAEPNGYNSGDTTESENMDDDDFEMEEVEVQGFVGASAPNVPAVDIREEKLEAKSKEPVTRNNTPPAHENPNPIRQESPTKESPTKESPTKETQNTLHNEDTTLNTQHPEKQISKILLHILKYPLRPTTDAFAKEWEPYFCASSKLSTYTIEFILSLLENKNWVQNDKDISVASDTDINKDRLRKGVEYMEILCGPEGPTVHYPKFADETATERHTGCPQPDLEMEARIALMAVVANANWKHGAFVSSLMKRISWRCCHWSEKPNNAEIVSRFLRVYTLICRSLDDLIPTRVLCNDIMRSIQKLPVQEQSKYQQSAIQALENAALLWPKITN